MIIGDGCLSKHQKKKTHNAYFQMTHCDAQYEYMLWKKDILENISKCNIWKNDKKTKDKTYGMYRLYSRANPFYTKLYNRFYMYGKKSVDEYLVKMITPLALAIMYMDDGCFGKGRDAFYLCLDNFDYANLFLIKKSLKIKFDLDWNINKTSRRFYMLRLLKKHNQRFVDIIYPYIIQVPCMHYKLGSYIGPQDEVETVRPLREREELGRNDQARLNDE
jgi:recombination protein RecA